MGFRENLLKKLKIDQLTGSVRQSMGAPDSPQRIDREAMREMLAMSDFSPVQERDLELYLLKEDQAEDQPLILVLDNELKLYRTTIEDVAMRKSPTVKEMVSIRNAIRILNDKDVVVSRKNDTLERIQKELIAGLDLSYTPDDIEALAQDGNSALQNQYAEGVVEVLSLFAELHGYQNAPKAFQLSHRHIWGRISKPGAGEVRIGPVIIFSRMDNSLKMMQQPVSSLDKTSMQHFQNVAKGDADTDLQGPAVFDALAKEVLQKQPRLS